MLPVQLRSLKLPSSIFIDEKMGRGEKAVFFCDAFWRVWVTVCPWELCSRFSCRHYHVPSAFILEGHGVPLCQQAGTPIAAEKIWKKLGASPFSVLCPSALWDFCVLFPPCILLLPRLFPLVLCCVFVFSWLLAPLLAGNIVKGRQLVYYFIIPESFLCSVLNKEHSINICLTSKQEGKLRFQEGGCNITKNHIKESE